MRKSTKGALAAMAAVALLLGGFGTHASWSDSRAFAGGEVIKDGSLSLGAVDCGSWRLFTDPSDQTGTLETTLSNVFLLPGQLLKRHCTVAVSLKGVGTVTATVGAPGLTLPTTLPTGDPGTGGLTVSTVVTNSGGAVTKDATTGVSTTTVSDADVISADFTVNLDSTVGTAWQNVSGTLNDLAVTVTA